jgi:hypothetical protein
MVQRESRGTDPWQLGNGSRNPDGAPLRTETEQRRQHTKQDEGRGQAGDRAQAPPKSSIL